MLRLAWPVLAIACGLLALWLLEPSPANLGELAVVHRPARTRLIVFLIDSLARRDVERTSAMPKLARRLHRSLHGPVRECADAITVPCMMAAITGADQLSVFALGKNFAGSSGAIDGSVLGMLERRGLHVGYFGERMLAAPMQGLSIVDGAGGPDKFIMKRALKALASGSLSVAIVHLHHVDAVAHAKKASSRHYDEALLESDALVARAIGQLAPTDHYLIMGDHGHTLSGRHAAGLEATTYAAYFGPQFSNGLTRPMAMTDQGALWARVFGLRRGPRTWIDDYFEGRSVTVPKELPALQTGAGVTQSRAWTSVSFGVFVAFALPIFGARSRRSLLAVLMATAWSVSWGIWWLDFRAFGWASSARLVLVSLALTLGCAALGASVLDPFLDVEGSERRPTRWLALFLGGAILLSLPTVYWYGGVHVPLAWLVLALGWFAWLRHKAGDRNEAWRFGVLAMLAATLYPDTIANYALRGFPLYASLLKPLVQPIAVACFGLALVMAGLVRRACSANAVAFVLGLSFAALEPWLGPTPYAIPCVLALPLTLLALRCPRIEPLALFALPPALWFWWANDRGTLAPLAVVLILFAALPKLFSRAHAMLQAGLLLTLLWLTLWTSMGCRITGIDFDFYFQFLPEGSDLTSHWFFQSVLTTAKYLTPACLGLWLARVTHARVLELAQLLCLGRLGLTLVLLATLRMVHPKAGAFIVGDIVQDAALTVVLSSVVFAVASFTARSASLAAADLAEPKALVLRRR